MLLYPLSVIHHGGLVLTPSLASTPVVYGFAVSRRAPGPGVAPAVFCDGRDAHKAGRGRSHAHRRIDGQVAGVGRAGCLGVWPGSRPGHTTRHHWTRPPGRPYPDTGDQGRTADSTVIRRAQGVAARLTGHPNAGTVCRSRAARRWSRVSRCPLSRASCAISPDPPLFPRGACPPGPDRRGLCLTSPERAAGSPVREQAGRVPAPGETGGAGAPRPGWSVGGRTGCVHSRRGSL
jgi:hypothetical protein